MDVEGAASSSRHRTSQSFQREQEFFGFHPVYFVDDLLSVVNEFTQKAIQEAEVDLTKALLANSKDDEESNEELTSGIQEGLEKVEALIKKQTDKYFDLWELYVLKNIFVVPSSIQQQTNGENEEDEMEEAATPHQVTPQEVNALDNEISHLKQRILATRYMNEALGREWEQAQAHLQRMQRHSVLIQHLISQCPSSHLGSVGEMLAGAVARRRELAQALRHTQSLKFNFETSPTDSALDMEAMFKVHTKNTDVDLNLQ